MSIEFQIDTSDDRGRQGGQPPIPVARPAAAAPPVPTGHDPEEGEIQEALVRPSAVKGWLSSMGLHAVFLLILALWVFTPRHEEAKPLETTIGGVDGGEGGGGDSGTPEGLEGLDQPLTLAPPQPTTSLEQPLGELQTGLVELDPAASLKVAASKSAGGGGGAAGVGAGGEGEGFGLARFGHGTENVGGVSVKVGDPQFTLIWDSQADLDIHVIEPGGSEIYWERPHGDKGGELDVDDVDGFGPENVFWVQGQGPPGEYRWFVHYYGGLAGTSVPTRWKVRVKHNGEVTIYKGRLNAIGARSKIYAFTIVRGSEAASTSTRGGK